MSTVGTTFAGYRLEQLLSTDTVSSVYRATPDGRTGEAARPVALRVTHELRAADGPDADAIATYIRSVSAAVKVTHPALVPIVDAGECDDRVYVATAMLDGVTLQRYVGDHGGLAADDAVALLRDLADALDGAHSVGVVHGAIGPRTVQVRRRAGGTPVAVLHGFGVDTLLARQARLDRTAIDSNDVAYVSPEHLRGVAINGRSDQYALACALYHCVAGVPPFRRDTAAGLFGAHLFGAVPASGAIDADRALRGALTAALEKAPDQRHASCSDLLRATAHAGATRGPMPAYPPTPPPGRGLSWPDDPVADRDPLRQAPGRRRMRRSGTGIRLGGARWPALAWPLAAMTVLAGIISTLAFVTIVRDRDRGATDRAADPGGSVVSGSLAATGDGPATAGVRWQRTVADEAVYDVTVIGDTVVAAAPHDVLALDADRGAMVWSLPVDVGVLTDLVATDDVVAVRAAKLRAVATADGAPRWEKADIVTPINALTTAAGTIYGIGVGRLAPQLQALDAATGRLVWSYDGGDEQIDDGASVVAIDSLVAMLDSDRLWALEPQGPRAAAIDDDGAAAGGARWQVTVDDAWLDSLAVLPDVVVIATRSGEVCAYDPADGDLRWCEPVSGIATESPTIVADGDTVVVIASDVTALGIATGARRWTFDAPRDLTPIAASTGRQLVVTDLNGRAYGLDLATGFETWRASGFGQVTALAASDDTVYAGTRAGTLLRVRPPVPDAQL